MFELQSMSVAAPAAGANWSVTVTANDEWNLRSAICTLTTSATVATRSLVLQVLDRASDVVMELPVGGTLAASSASDFCWVSLAGSTTTGNNAAGQVGYGVLPDGWFPPGWSVRVSTNNLQTGDQYSAIYLVYRVKPTPLLQYEGQLTLPDLMSLLAD